MPESWPADGLEAVRACPSCGAIERTALHANLEDRVFGSAPGRWTLHRCGGCGAAYLDPRPTPETIGLAYRRYYTHGEQATAEPAPTPLLGFRHALANGYLNARYGYKFTPAFRIGVLTAAAFPKRRLIADLTVRHLSRRPGGRLLDVGCGNGAFLNSMRPAGWDVHGIEPDPEAASVARAAGVPVEGALTEDTFPARSFDAVTLNHVIEHLHDPGETLRICRTILRPGGTLWIATPNLEGAGHRRFGRDWLHLDPPRHLVLFTRSALVQLVRAESFERLRFQAPRSAPEVFAFSAALAAGLDPQGGELPVSRSLLLRARLADLVTSWRPSNAEELVLLAERPR